MQILMDDAPQKERLVRQRLRRREVLFRVKVAAMFLFGVPLTFVGPLFLAFAFWVAGLFTGLLSLDRFWTDWSLLFAALTIVVVPLLFRQEISAGQAYIDEALQDSDTCVLTGAPLMPGIAGGVGALVAVAANPRAVSAWSVYVFLIGPRLVVDAYRMTKLARGLPTVNVEQAAEVVCTLMSQSEGVETSSLLQPGKRFDDLLPTLAYLVFYRWIGVGDGWKRVWLWSQVREALRGL